LNIGMMFNMHSVLSFFMVHKIWSNIIIVCLSAVTG
jgi:hypothetical protein